LRSLRPTLRVRLTATYTLLFGVSTALLLAASYWLIGRHLDRTLPESLAGDAMSDLGTQYLIAFLGALALAVGVGWAVAGRTLAPISRITRAARRVSDERLDERIALEGPADELRELADTFDSMLDGLAESFDAQRRFIANASHELRSPLTVIRSEAEIALANPDADVAELRAMGEVVIEAAKRNEALLESLMVLARSQRRLLRLEDVDLALVARAAISPAFLEAREADVRLRLEVEPAPTVGDRRLLERLVANLVENAVRYNERGGVVEISTGGRDGSAVVRVANTGPRISPQDAERLAAPFERLNRHADPRGAGLGLSIVRSVTEAHGGTLRLAARPSGGLEVEAALPDAR
jgi:signal transduction histidine kinase